jgi:hypothetical protein
MSEAGDAPHAGPGDADAAPAPGGVRFANLSPDGPPVDFCIAQHGTGLFQGPMLANLTTALAEGGMVSFAGLNFPQVSAYALVPPGLYDARVIVNGADCSVSGLVDQPATLTVGIGGFGTIALLGHAQPAGQLKLLGLQDDTTPGPAADGGASSPKMYMRFVHAAPDQGPVDFGLDLNGKGAKPIFTGVDFTRTGTPANAIPDAGLKVDDAGYLASGGPACMTGNPLPCPAVRVEPSSQEEAGVVLLSGTFTGTTGAVLTIALIPNASPDAGATAPPSFLECVDNAATVQVLGNCSVLP